MSRTRVAQLYEYIKKYKYLYTPQDTKSAY